MLDESTVSINKKRRVAEDNGHSAAAAAAEEAQDSCSEGLSEKTNGHDEAESGKLQGWAPPGLGVCQLWAQQASSLKRKKGEFGQVFLF